MIKNKCTTLLIHGSIGLIVLIGLICGFLAFDASQHTARAATLSIQSSHHAHNSDGKSPSRRRSTSRYHYSTTHYYHSSGTSGSLDSGTTIVIIIVGIIILAFWAIFKWLRQGDYNDE
ncbi:hypothetical protein [Dictyobacter formicarum]|uniref:hypothetical protein n=1 Tax=Dictyobacter formicarum TaxID=2778368 RepID=UPI0019168CF7|nr:hypothetical protein [Dictyobacter formicarum]